MTLPRSFTIISFIKFEVEVVGARLDNEDFRIFVGKGESRIKKTVCDLSLTNVDQLGNTRIKEGICSTA